MVSVEQYLSLDHPINPNPNDPLGLGANTVAVTVTATDGDGDPVTSGAVDISGQITFLDDGPAIDPAVNAQATVTVDESLPSNDPLINTGAIVKGNDPDLAGGLAIGQANSGVAVVNAGAVFGADGAAIGGGLTYGLSITSANSGVTLTDGTAINLQLVGGVIVGVVASGAFAGQAAFAIAINASTGVVSVEQYLSLDHPINPNPNDPLGLGPNTVGVTVSGTDGDGDPVTSGAVDISGQITFLDDGPTMDPGVNSNSTVVVDESLPSTTPGINTGAIVKGDDPDLAGGLALGQASSGGAIVNANAVFGADGPAAGGGLAYSLSITNAASGVTLTDGSAINLQLVGGVIVGVVASGAFAGQAAFAIAINSTTGVVTVEQYLSLDHPINPNPNDPLGLGPNTIAAHVVATDGDGDSVDSGAIDISGQITFLDDGPSAVPTVNANATVTVDESLPSDTPGINTGAIVKGNDPDLPGGIALGQANSGAAIVNAGAVFGADGAAAGGGISYALSVINAPSGVTLTDGSAINLQLVGGVIVGVVASGAFAGQAAFAIAINSSTGVVTVEQYLSLDHPINPNPNDPLGLGANTVGVTVTATDGDGDPVTSAAVDVSGQITFLDDGPTAANDVDSIVGGNGPATGNVITGVDFIGGDSNTTDGSADAPGADGGSITFIDHSNGAPGVAVPGGGSVAIAGDYGVLTIFANGNYSYLRNDGSAGGVSDVFTYTLTDGDGDPVTATLTIAIDDHFPTAGNVNVQLDDDARPGGNPGTPAVNDDPDSVNASGTLPGAGGDPALTWDLLTTGQPAGFTYVDGAGGSVEVFQGVTKVLTITVNAANGQYTVTQNAPILHTAGNLENNTSFTINYVVTDADGDPANGTITINVDDDTPVVNVTQTSEGNVLLTTQDAQTDGVPTDTDTDVSTANFGGVFGLTQSIGADGGAAGSLSYALAVTDSVSGLSSQGLAINLYNVGGVIVGSTAGSAGAINAGNTIFNIAVSGTGAVTLSQFQQIDHPIAADPTPTGTPFEDQLAVLANGKVTLTASVTITDNDGDSATDQEVIDLGGNIRFADDGPIAVNDSVNQVTENAPITFSVFGNDSFGADGVDIDNNPTVNVTFTQPAQGSVSYNPATGQFTFTPAPGQTGSPTFTYTIKDFDGDTSTPTVTVNLQPDSTPQTTNGVAAVDDDGLTGGNALSVTGDLNANAGEAAPVNPSEAIFHGQLVATGGGDTIANYSFASMNGTNGVVGTETVLYSWNNGTSTLTATTVGGTRAGTPLFQVVVNQATGEYNLTLLDNVLHAAGSNENDATTNLTFTATDSDGDPANGTIVVTFDDDAPTLGTIQNGTANNLPGSAHSIGTLHLTVGADSPASVVGITADNSGVTSGGKALVTNFSGNVLTAYQDANGNGTYDAATDTTAVYTLTVNPNAGTSGQYDFDLITPLDPTITDTPIGGSSSFGAGPTTFQVLNSPAPASAPLAVVSGYLTTGTFNEANWLATGTTATTTLTTAGVNGSTAGWGIDNNNFEGTNEFFNWDFGSAPLDDPDGAGGFTPPVNPGLPDISFATYDFIGYTAADDIKYVVHFTDGTFASGTIPAANLGAGPNWTFTAPAGKFIADIEMFSSGTAPGKVDLVSVGVQSSSISEDISFNVTLQDQDGDQVSGGFTMNIAGGNSPSTAAAPVAVDLNGDGVHFLAADAGVHYDYNGDGAKEATAWVGPNDGILARDANGNGTVDGASEFVFGANGQTDMQALAAQYGSTLDANDADYAKFGVWQDANSNGAVDSGEYQTLAAAGITSINLVSDGVSYSAAGGDVDVAGSATYTNSDGSTGIVADAAFWSGGLAAQEQLRTASTSNIAIAAAVAAAGLAAQAAPAAAPPAEEADHGQDVTAASVSAGPSVAAAAGQADDASRSALTNETKEAANDAAPAESSSHSQSDSHESTGLDVASSSSSDSSGESHEAVDQGPAAATASLAPSAQEVAMPSAEALQAAGLTGEAQHGGSVEKIVAAALGSAAAPTVDALLQSLTGGGHDGPDALANLASTTAAHVPGWDMPAQGAFGHGAEMMIMMHAQMLHQDAVQPTANG